MQFNRIDLGNKCNLSGTLVNMSAGAARYIIRVGCAIEADVIKSECDNKISSHSKNDSERRLFYNNSYVFKFLVYIKILSILFRDIEL